MSGAGMKGWPGSSLPIAENQDPTLGNTNRAENPKVWVKTIFGKKYTWEISAGNEEPSMNLRVLKIGKDKEIVF